MRYIDRYGPTYYIIILHVACPTTRNGRAVEYIQKHAVIFIYLHQCFDRSCRFSNVKFEKTLRHMKRQDIFFYFLHQLFLKVGVTFHCKVHTCGNQCQIAIYYIIHYRSLSCIVSKLRICLSSSYNTKMLTVLL